MGLSNLVTPAVIRSVEVGILSASIIGVFKYARDYLLNLRLKTRLKEDAYTPAEIKNRLLTSQDPYVRPDCQDYNPASIGPTTKRRPIFQETGRLLGPPLIGRFTLVLGDSGMGKSTFLERYYAYHWRSPKRSARFKPVVIPLNGLDADELVNTISVQARGETVLMLDALDEDNAAITDFAKRFDEIVKLAGKFRAVVISCRTQFLTDVACVPEEIDLPAPSGPKGLSEGLDRRVRRLYLSPFSDAQVKKYLAARFRYWRTPVARMRAKRAAHRFKDLMSRPLLLTYIDDLASKSELKYSFQAYRTIVESWLNREVDKRRLTIRPSDLLHFSEELAVNLFSNGRDRIPTAELQSLAERFRVTLVPREVRERSLLHNDAEGNWKFSHRSIMEYLLVNAASEAKERPPWAGQPWTDQMRVFAREMLISGECKQVSTKFDGWQMRGVKETIRALKEHLDQIMGALCDGLVVFTRDTRVVLVSASAERFVGRPRGEILGNVVEEVFNDANKLGRIVLDAFALHQPIPQREIELENGRRIQIALDFIAERGERTGALLIMRDVSDVSDVYRGKYRGPLAENGRNQ